MKSFRLLHLCEGGDCLGRCESLTSLYDELSPIHLLSAVSSKVSPIYHFSSFVLKSILGKRLILF